MSQVFVPLALIGFLFATVVHLTLALAKITVPFSFVVAVRSATVCLVVVLALTMFSCFKVVAFVILTIRSDLLRVASGGAISELAFNIAASLKRVFTLAFKLAFLEITFVNVTAFVGDFASTV